MYNVSQDFHEAVKAGKPQMALLMFDDAVFSNDDISLDRGIEFTELFNSDEDLSIGGTPSSQLSFTLFNENVTTREQVEHSMSVVQNQLVLYGNFTSTSGWRKYSQHQFAVSDNVGTLTVNATTTTSAVWRTDITYVSGHKYFATVDLKCTKDEQYLLFSYTNSVEGSICTLNAGDYQANAWYTLSGLFDGDDAVSSSYPFYVRYGMDRSRLPSGEKLSLRNAMVVDLTLMFGAGNEPTAEEFKIMCPLEYYSYDTGTQTTITWTAEEDVEKPVLSEYSFGTCKATIGVQTSVDSYAAGASSQKCRTYYRTGTANTYRFDYVTGQGIRYNTGSINDNAQPTFSPTSILYYYSNSVPHHNLYVFDETGNIHHIQNTSISKYGWTVSSDSYNLFMREKFKRIAKRKTGYALNDNSRYFSVCDDSLNRKYTYECCPLGIFKVERPKVSTTITLDIDANDQMQLFDADIPDGLFSYPTTIGGMLTAMCSHLGINCTTTSFINKTATISSKPENMDNQTMRNVLAWIAEAACAIARFDRDGNLELAWLNPLNITLDESDYSEFEPYYFNTPTINKLYVRNTTKGADKTKTEAQTDGDCGYLIQDNPLLKNAVGGDS